MAKNFKLVVTVPAEDAQRMRSVIGEAGAGRTASGKYEFASFSSRGIGRFRPLEGAKPFLGEIGRIEEVEEERIETVVGEDLLENVLAKIREAHPYEEPVIDVLELK